MNVNQLIANLYRWKELHGDLDVVFEHGDTLQEIDYVLLAEYEDETKQIVLAKKEFTDGLFDKTAHRGN